MERAENLNKEKLITISVDEYFDLRTKAEINALFFDRLSYYESRICSLEIRIDDLERKVGK